MGAVGDRDAALRRGAPVRRARAATQGVYVVLTRVPLRVVVPAFATVLILGIPFWRTDLVLAGRFDVGVGNGSTTLGSPGRSRPTSSRRRRLHGGLHPGDHGRAAARPRGLREPRPAHAARSGADRGCRRRPARGAVLAKLGSAAPMSRHLIFMLPFFALVVAEGLIRVASPATRWAPLVAVVGHRWRCSRPRSPGACTGRRSSIAAKRAFTSRPERPHRPTRVGRATRRRPLRLRAALPAGARPRREVSKSVVPRADATFALKAFQSARKPLGHGIWVFDASDTTNGRHARRRSRCFRRALVELHVKAFGPYPRRPDRAADRLCGPLSQAAAPGRGPRRAVARARRRRRQPRHGADGLGAARIPEAPACLLSTPSR